MTTYGYARVSTREQHDDRQIFALTEAGVLSQNLIQDKQSGANFTRPGYLRLLKKLGAGDTLIVKSIDRLGRNYEEILEQWRYLTKEKRVAIVVLDMPLLDTREGRDLTGTLISDIVLQLLSYVAQTEREYIRQRQREGIEAAKARGVRFGRRPMDRPDNYAEIFAAWQTGKLSGRRCAKLLNVSPACFRKWIKQDREQGILP